MTTILRPLLRPWRTSFRATREMAHEQPVFFWSIVLGFMGPIALIVVPPIREKLGYKPRPEIPTSYPVPNRQRRPVTGYEDP